ncbi:hypothetical protein CKA32_005961 [Geitlerinema sp. FC II]|nr:hypothetical protein CKA32_005961 [Geitlerinema sp. FC II]
MRELGDPRHGTLRVGFDRLLGTVMWFGGLSVGAVRDAGRS